MAVTLADAKLAVQDDLQMGVIDEFRKSSWILDHILFDDCVSPTGGGATSTYTYLRLLTQPTANFRAVNGEYTSAEVTRQKISTDVKIFGGSYKIDRIIADMRGAVDEVQLQQSQKIKAAQALFNDTFINGDTDTNANAFDGLDKAITGSSTEFNAGASASVIDLSTSSAIDSNYKAFLDLLDEFMCGLDGTPSCIMGNTKLIARLRACARRSAMYQTTLNQWGEQVECYGTIPFIDMRTKSGSNDDVIATGSDGTTSLYVARLGLDGVHAVSFAGNAPVQSWLPDYTTAGAVKTGEVEMNAGVLELALKKGTDLVVAVGSLMCRAAELLRAKETGEGTHGGRLVSFETREDFLAAAGGMIKPGDVVLVKSSHSMHMDEIAAALAREGGLKQ